MEQQPGINYSADCVMGKVIILNFVVITNKKDKKHG